MKTQVFDGMTIEKGGRIFRVNIVDEDFNRQEPWKEYDGCGIVRKSKSRHSESLGDKQPGERPMNSPDRNEYQFYYDWKRTTEKAKSERWGLSEKHINELTVKLGRPPTKGEIIRGAVDRDFEYLAGWVNDEWRYVTVDITDITDDKNAECNYDHCMGGVENHDDEYLLSVAHELIADSLRDIENENLQNRINSRFHDAMQCGL